MNAQVQMCISTSSFPAETEIEIIRFDMIGTWNWYMKYVLDCLRCIFVSSNIFIIAQSLNIDPEASLNKALQKRQN